MKQPTGKMKFLYDRIAELEAENAELKKALTIAKTSRNFNRNKQPTREQIAALVKGLEWEGNTSFSGLIKYDVWFGVDNKWHYIKFLSHRNYNTDTPVSNSFETDSEARAAAESHHKETVLNLFNLPA